MSIGIESNSERKAASGVPVAVVMLTLNEAHNMDAALDNIKGWAKEVFLVDSYSNDNTVDVALRHEVHVVQRRFRGFGDQWNFALECLPITAPWTMKLDPDERLSNELKANIGYAIAADKSDALELQRQLWFMGKRIPIKQNLIRVWRTGRCRFTDVAVNEHPIVDGKVEKVKGFLEHHDSPDLHHWVDKQNRYTTAEAVARLKDAPLAVKPALFGSPLARRMWLKKHFMKIPLRYKIMHLLYLWRVKPWVSGHAGLAWARLRVWVFRLREDKYREMKNSGREIQLRERVSGKPHPSAHQAE